MNTAVLILTTLQVESLLLQNVRQKLIEVVQPHDEPVVRALVRTLLASDGGEGDVSEVNDFHCYSRIFWRVFPSLNRKIEANVNTEFKII